MMQSDADPAGKPAVVQSSPTMVFDFLDSEFDPSAVVEKPDQSGSSPAAEQIATGEAPRTLGRAVLAEERRAFENEADAANPPNPAVGSATASEFTVDMHDVQVGAGGPPEGRETGAGGDQHSPILRDFTGPASSDITTGTAGQQHQQHQHPLTPPPHSSLPQHPLAEAEMSEEEELVVPAAAAIPTSATSSRDNVLEDQVLAFLEGGESSGADDDEGGTEGGTVTEGLTAETVAPKKTETPSKEIEEAEEMEAIALNEIRQAANEELNEETGEVADEVLDYLGFDFLGGADDAAEAAFHDAAGAERQGLSLPKGSPANNEEDGDEEVIFVAAAASSSGAEQDNLHAVVRNQETSELFERQEATVGAATAAGAVTTTTEERPSGPHRAITIDGFGFLAAGEVEGTITAAVDLTYDFVSEGEEVEESNQSSVAGQQESGRK